MQTRWQSHTFSEASLVVHLGELYLHLVLVYCTQLVLCACFAFINSKGLLYPTPKRLNTKQKWPYATQLKVNPLQGTNIGRLWTMKPFFVDKLCLGNLPKLGAEADVKEVL